MFFSISQDCLLVLWQLLAPFEYLIWFFDDFQLILFGLSNGFQSRFLHTSLNLSVSHSLPTCEAHPKPKTHFMRLCFMILWNFAWQIEIFSAFSCLRLVCARNYNATIFCRLKYFSWSRKTYFMVWLWNLHNSNENSWCTLCRFQVRHAVFISEWIEV